MCPPIRHDYEAYGSRSAFKLPVFPFCQCSNLGSDPARYGRKRFRFEQSPKRILKYCSTIYYRPLPWFEMRVTVLAVDDAGVRHMLEHVHVRDEAPTEK